MFEIFVVLALLALLLIGFIGNRRISTVSEALDRLRAEVAEAQKRRASAPAQLLSSSAWLARSGTPSGTKTL